MGAMPLLIFSMPSGPELMLILLVGLLVFGGRLPEVARSIGKGLIEFRRGLSDLDREVKTPMKAAIDDTVKQTMKIEAPVASVPYSPARPASAEPIPGDRGASDVDQSAHDLSREG